MDNLAKLREAGIAHPTHEFSEEEKALFDSLTDDEVNTLINVKHKLGDALTRKKSDPVPDTLVL